MALVEKKPTSKVYIDIDGEKGNAFYLLSQVRIILLMFDLNFDYNKIVDEMKSGDYINLLKVFDKYFGDYVTLQTSNPEYLDAFSSMWTVK